jgi:drug/metabolite transporter (DMT)-like permease
VRQRKGRMVAQPGLRQPDGMSRLAWTLLLALALLWGGSFFFVGVAVHEWPPLMIVLARVGLAAIALWAVVLLLRLELRTDGAALRAHLGMGMLNNVLPFLLIVWAQSPAGGGLASGAASILNATTPLWGVMLAHTLGAERATGLRVAGVIAGFLGVAAMLGGNLAEAPLAGTLAMLTATFAYASAGLWGRRFKALGIPPLVAAAGQVSVASLLLLPLALGLHPPGSLPWPGLPVLGALLGLALFSTALAYLLYFRILDLAGPVNLLLVTLLIPVVAILLGVLVLGEQLGPHHGAGLVLIALGLAMIDGRVFRRRR